jgi:molybdopterin-binding protein
MQLATAYRLTGDRKIDGNGILKLASARFMCCADGMGTRYRPGQIAELLGVSSDTVRRWCDDGRLGTTRSGGGHRLVDGAELARFLREQGGPWEPESLPAQSARNRFTGVVTRVEVDGLVAVLELQAGPHRLVSLITADGASELGLEPGDLAVAVVKATNVIVEAPR